MSNPPINLYDSVYPVVRAALETLTALLAKGQETAGANALPNARLCEDMSPLTTQVQYVCNIIRNLVSRTTGQDLSATWDADVSLSTFQDMHARVAATLELVDVVDENMVNKMANETFVLVSNAYGTLHLCTHAWVTTHILPYLFFYLVTAYGILRKEGVPLRLPDYMNQFNNILKDRPAIA